MDAQHFRKALPEHGALSLAASTRAQRALGLAVRRHIPAMYELRRAMEACVREMHDDGASPQRMLIDMKAFVRKSAIAHPPVGYLGSSRAADSFMDEIVHWCIDEYFRGE